MDPYTKRSQAFLQKDIKRILSNSQDTFSLKEPTDIYTWNILIIGPQNTIYENGIYRAIMKFPKTYPEDPPTFTFLSEMFHPNIDENGRVCVSILHTGDDITGYESMTDRWMPVRSPESVILSIVSLLDEPNCESPANVDAANLYRNNIKEYQRIVRRLAQKSLE